LAFSRLVPPPRPPPPAAGKRFPLPLRVNDSPLLDDDFFLAIRFVLRKESLSPSSPGCMQCGDGNGLLHSAIRQLAELIKIIAAVNDARIDERRGFGWHTGNYSALWDGVNAESS
jgi:hypothetical protein